jgi:hypothetical protein
VTIEFWMKIDPNIISSLENMQDKEIVKMVHLDNFDEKSSSVNYMVIATDS